MRIYLFAFFLAIFFITGCGERKPSTLPQTRMNGEESQNLGESVSAPIFPHTSDWAIPSVHGAWVNQSGFTVCLNCHQTESTQVETIPTCASCHALFPHPDNWPLLSG